MNAASNAPPSRFSGYQKVVVGILAFLQFAVIFDFMLLLSHATKRKNPRRFPDGGLLSTDV
jgi:hypothetical protein